MKIFRKTIQILKPVTSRLSSTQFSSVAPEKIDPFQESVLKQKLILVNDNDELIGSASKHDCHRVVRGKIPLHRAFSVFLFNSKNDIILTQRSSSKVTYPNYITNACCSHPEYDILISRDNHQTMKLSVQRRLHFELGIKRSDFTDSHLNYVTKIHYFSTGDGVWGEHEIDHIFVMQRDVSFHLNLLEVQRIFTVPRKEFNSFIKNCEYPLTPWFELIVKDWLFKWWDNLERIRELRDDKIHRYVK